MAGTGGEADEVHKDVVWHASGVTREQRREKKVIKRRTTIESLITDKCWYRTTSGVTIHTNLPVLSVCVWTPISSLGLPFSGLGMCLFSMQLVNHVMLFFLPVNSNSLLLFRFQSLFKNSKSSLFFF